MSTILVGAGPGLGQAIAERFSRDGHPVGLIARSRDRLEEQARSLRAAGAVVATASADVCDAEGLCAAIDHLHDKLGAPEVLVYNAALADRRPPCELTADDLLHALRVDVVGALIATNHVAPSMKAAGRGTILFTGGGYADRPWAGMASLGVGKAALRNLARCFAQELGAHQVHVATVTLHGRIQEGTALAPTRIAEVYAALHREPAGAWRTEVDLPS